ncbi:MAG TPA: hypothetical protein VG167_03610 [Verrucomicrobiae bacterium]|nr:hypothetical protein [Verrucomicrobiae bacterium]
MKTLPTSFWIALAILGLGTGAYAQDTNSSSAAAQPGVATTLSAAPEPLPYGVLDVLKLSQAHVGDGIIVNYILNSGTIYHLTPNDILYLRSQGVSDPVLNAMLSQRQRAEAAAAAQNAEAAQAASAMGSAPAPGQAPTQAMPSPQDQSPGIITPPTPAPRAWLKVGASIP